MAAGDAAVVVVMLLMARAVLWLDHGAVAVCEPNPAGRGHWSRVLSVSAKPVRAPFARLEAEVKDPRKRGKKGMRGS